MTPNQIKTIVNSGLPFIVLGIGNAYEPVAWLVIKHETYYYDKYRKMWNQMIRTKETMIEQIVNGQFNIVDYFEESLDSRDEWPSYL